MFIQLVGLYSMYNVRLIFHKAVRISEVFPNQENITEPWFLHKLKSVLKGMYL